MTDKPHCFCFVMSRLILQLQCQPAEMVLKVHGESMGVNCRLVGFQEGDSKTSGLSLDNKTSSFHFMIEKGWFAVYNGAKNSEYADQVMRKLVLCHMRTTKMQISLRIRAV